jgi:hypothetical protein
MTEPEARGTEGQAGTPGETAIGALTVIPPPSGRSSIGDADGTLPAFARLLPPAPVGADARAVRAWFDDAVETAEPEMDGTLGAERAAAQAYCRGSEFAIIRRRTHAEARVCGLHRDNFSPLSR